MLEENKLRHDQLLDVLWKRLHSLLFEPASSQQDQERLPLNVQIGIAAFLPFVKDATGVGHDGDMVDIEVLWEIIYNYSRENSCRREHKGVLVDPVLSFNFPLSRQVMHSEALPVNDLNLVILQRHGPSPDIGSRSHWLIISFLRLSGLKLD